MASGSESSSGGSQIAASTAASRRVVLPFAAPSGGAVPF